MGVLFSTREGGQNCLVAFHAILCCCLSSSIAEKTTLCCELVNVTWFWVDILMASKAMEKPGKEERNELGIYVAAPFLAAFKLQASYIVDTKICNSCTVNN